MPPIVIVNDQLDTFTTMGVVLGVTDGPDGCAVVSMVGPLARLELAKRVVEIVSKGANSLLDRLEGPPSLG